MGATPTDPRQPARGRIGKYPRHHQRPQQGPQSVLIYPSKPHHPHALPDPPSFVTQGFTRGVCHAARRPPWYRSVIARNTHPPGEPANSPPAQRGPQAPHRRRRRSRTPKITLGLLTSLGLAYALQLALGTEQNPFLLVNLGANVPVLVQQGQLDRLVTAAWLHGGLLHLAMNGFALWSLGGVLEPLLGRSRFASVYFLSCIGGALGSTWAAQALLSVGSSTGIAGLLGALAVIQLRFRDRIPAQFQARRRFWITLVLINGAVILLVPNIDHAGHLGGLLTGALCTLLITLTHSPLSPAAPLRWAGPAVGSLCLLAATAGLGVSAKRYLTHPSEGRLAMVHVLQSQSPPDPLANNYYAWEIAIDPSATPLELQAAHQLAKQAVVQAPSQIEIQDTLATLLHRQKAHHQAVIVQQGVVQADPSRVFLSQLARFLTARQMELGTYKSSTSLPEVTLAVRTKPDGTTLLTGRLSEHVPPNGITVYALVHRSRELVQEELLGMVQLHIGKEPRLQFEEPTTKGWIKGNKLTVAWVETSREQDVAQRWSWSATRMDPEVNTYP